MTSKHLTTALAAIGGASLLFAGASLGKLFLAIHKQCDFASIFHPVPRRDAFSGRVFWITGASSGIGRALALYLCSSFDNVKLILSSRREDVLEEVAAACRQLGTGNQVKVLPLDLGELSALPTKAENALSFFGSIDVLVNNGGVSTRCMATRTSFDVDIFVANIDFLSYVSLTKALLPSWEKQGNNRTENFHPLIINTSSVAGKIGAPVRTSYCAAKHAVLGWFDAFRIEQIMLGKPVDVLNIVLGSTRTNIAHNSIVESVEAKFGASDANINSGLDPEHVVRRVLAAAHAGRQEIWIAPKKEMVFLYLSQYIPDTAKRIMMKSMMKYAVQKQESHVT